MSVANKSECLRSAVANSESAGHRRRTTESVNFPPATSIVRPFDAEVKKDIADLVKSVPEIDNMCSIVDKIGAGTFSSVYLADAKNCGRSRQQYALKHLVPTSHPSRIENELRCLKELGGQASVIAVKTCVRHNDHIVIVMPYFEHDRLQDYIKDMTVDEIRGYTRALLMAVAHVHHCKIIHRDIKHSNFLYNRRLKQFALVDFGLAQILSESSSHSSQDRQMANSEAEPQKNSSNLSVAATSKQRSLSTRTSVGANENLQTSALQQFDTLQGMNSLNTRSGGETVARNTLQALNPNVCLTRLDVDPMKSSSINVGQVNKKLPLRRDGPTCHESNNATRHPSRHDDSAVTTKPRRHSASKTRTKCRCFGRPMVCSVCLTRPTEKAPRAGTPGYRAPEVLMKYPQQTTAVDVWSVGVIFLSLLAAHYPIFKAADDMEALSQIICVFGSEELKTAAKSYGKQLDCLPASVAMDLKELCYSLRQRDIQSTNHMTDIPDSAFDLLRRLLDLNPFSRITAADALQHPFVAENPVI